MRYIASCSFGKDSIAMLYVIKANPQKYPLDEIVFCDVKFSKELSGNFEIMKSFINKTIPRIEEEFGVPVTIVGNEMSFVDYFYRKKEKGKAVGQIYGFPYTLGAWCNDRLKMKPLDTYFRSKGEHIRYIGIAYDEPNRYAKLEENEIAPLYTEGVIEAEAMQICIEHNMRSPIYDYFDRDGCFFCPKQSLASLRVMFDNFRTYWDILVKMQKDSPIEFRPNMSLITLDEKFKNGFIPKRKRK